MKSIELETFIALDAAVILAGKKLDS